MPRGKILKPRFGELLGSFDALSLREDFLRAGNGELKLETNHGYIILEATRIAKLAFDQNRKGFPNGKVMDFETRLQVAMTNAAFVEVSFCAEIRLLGTLWKSGQISSETLERRNRDAESWYEERWREAANGAAGLMEAIETATAKRGRGRPSSRLVPNKSDHLDWQVIMFAARAVTPGDGSVSPWKKHFDAIPDAVREAVAEGLLSANEYAEPGKQLTAHVERIRRRFERVFKRIA